MKRGGLQLATVDGVEEVSLETGSKTVGGRDKDRRF